MRGNHGPQPEPTPPVVDGKAHVVEDHDSHRGAPEDPVLRQHEAKRVVKRLLAIIEDHRISAQRLEVTIGASEIETVVDALKAETEEGDPQSILDQKHEIRTYVLTSLYEELLEEPSNILFTTQVNPDTVRYDSMEPAFWSECLDYLKRLIGDVAQASAH